MLMEAGQFGEAEALLNQLLLHVESVKVRQVSWIFSPGSVGCLLTVLGFCWQPCWTPVCHLQHIRVVSTGVRDFPSSSSQQQQCQTRALLQQHHQNEQLQQRQVHALCGAGA